METRYDKIVNYLLDYWFVAAFVIVAIVIMALPQVKDGLKMVSSFFKALKNRFTHDYMGETITYEIKLKSHDFDVVKIHATTHRLGIHAEYEWLGRNYPGYQKNMQFLEHIITDNGETITFDIITIHNETELKEIYFDITDFYNGAHVEFTGNIHKYAESKIRDLYK